MKKTSSLSDSKYLSEQAKRDLREIEYLIQTSKRNLREVENDLDVMTKVFQLNPSTLHSPRIVH